MRLFNTKYNCRVPQPQVTSKVYETQVHRYSTPPLSESSSTPTTTVQCTVQTLVSGIIMNSPPKSLVMSVSTSAQK